MYEAQREDNWRYILGDSGAKVAFVANDRIRARIAAFHDEVPALTHVVVFDTGSDSPEDALALAGLGRDTPPVGLTPTKPEDMAGFVYTSGTTGNPKRVMLSHGEPGGQRERDHRRVPPRGRRPVAVVPVIDALGTTVYEGHGLSETSPIATAN